MQAPDTTRPDLPDFADPPVAEVVLSVQFQPLALRAAHVGLLWNEFRQRLSKTEDKPALGHVIEDFGPAAHRRIGLRIEALEAPPVPRTWFLNEAGTELIQVQPDRFVHNWRKVGEGDEYPRYERIRAAFRRELDTFASFLSSEGVGELRFDQCEVTYVNHIRGGKGWERHGQVANVFHVWSESPADGFLQEPEDATFSMRYRIPGPGGGPAGRLLLQVQPGWDSSDLTPLYVLNLTARGAPLGPGMDGAFAFLDLGRTWIVRGFASITTQAMHSIWRRLDAD